MIGLQRPWASLREAGALGLNSRNIDYIMAYNERRLYPLVDDKLRTKRLADKAGISVPELYGVVESQHDVRNFASMVEGRSEFVIKPAHGSGGDGIIVVAGTSNRSAGRYRLIDGRLTDESELRYHLSNILSGQYSLGGTHDHALIEYCVRFDPVFEDVCYLGVPDVRILVFRGFPAMAMIRLPTRESRGRANLHQGALGAGIDIVSGITTGGVSGNALISEHPDTGAPVAGIRIPHWDTLLDLAAGCYELTGLGYLGVDIVLDRELGPLILELNARPGLNIQLASSAGLAPRLEYIRDIATVPDSPGERAEVMRSWLAAT